MGHTSQRLQQMIKQHVLETIFQALDQNTLARSCKSVRSLKAETFYSAKGQHLLQSACHVHVKTMMTTFPFLAQAVMPFISLLLKPLGSNHPNQIYVNKKNSCMA